jgi:hypothetical protein
MDINSLFKEIEEELPEKHEELIESLEIFKATLSETIDSLQRKIDYKIKNRNFEDSEKIFQIAKDCNKLEQKIDNIYNYSPKNKFKNPKHINYEEYGVNNKIEHSIHENFKYKRPYGFRINAKNIIEVNSWQEMLIKTCEILYEVDKEKFLDLENRNHMNGKKRKYFTRNQDILRVPGSINDTVYVELNQSSNSIIKIIKKLLEEFNYSLNKYIIYLRADYTDLNVKRN